MADDGTRKWLPGCDGSWLFRPFYWLESKEIGDRAAEWAAGHCENHALDDVRRQAEAGFPYGLHCIKLDAIPYIVRHGKAAPGDGLCAPIKCIGGTDEQKWEIAGGVKSVKELDAGHWEFVEALKDSDPEF